MSADVTGRYPVMGCELRGGNGFASHSEIHHFVRNWLLQRGIETPEIPPVLDDRHVEIHAILKLRLSDLDPTAPPAPVIAHTAPDRARRPSLLEALTARPQFGRSTGGLALGHTERHNWEVDVIRRLDEG